eukprot:ctg_2821.g592
MGRPGRAVPGRPASTFHSRHTRPGHARASISHSIPVRHFSGVLCTPCASPTGRGAASAPALDARGYPTGVRAPRAHLRGHRLQLPSGGARRFGRDGYRAGGRFAGYGGARLPDHPIRHAGADAAPRAGGGARVSSGAHRRGHAIRQLRGERRGRHAQCDAYDPRGPRAGGEDGGWSTHCGDGAGVCAAGGRSRDGTLRAAAADGERVGRVPVLWQKRGGGADVSGGRVGVAGCGRVQCGAGMRARATRAGDHRRIGSAHHRYRGWCGHQRASAGVSRSVRSVIAPASCQSDAQVLQTVKHGAFPSAEHSPYSIPDREWERFATAYEKLTGRSTDAADSPSAEVPAAAAGVEKKTTVANDESRDTEEVLYPR